MKNWIIQPCTFKTLAALYELTEKILRTHLKPFQQKIGKKIGHTYTVKQLLIIFEEYCPPANVEVIYPEPVPVRKKDSNNRIVRKGNDFNALTI
ncbi:hypothetical protein [Ohtaekwangia koreensis]|uniref:Uncharacterized protein n=1 Tax=Ohtaekwangia koreensis TaxID=688867 RepID=A0A1T5J958_9BACT|nr:hypothetical protein [Ohtaekwangia koreensis]SKC47792.1 hypothetical protein SAMN05660236_0874 [Ohtaekwangia koreensis]